MSTSEEEKRLKDIQKKILEFSAKSRVSSGIEEISVGTIFLPMIYNVIAD